MKVLSLFASLNISKVVLYLQFDSSRDNSISWKAVAKKEKATYQGPERRLGCIPEKIMVSFLNVDQVLVGHERRRG